MTKRDSAAQLRAIIRTQTEIAAHLSHANLYEAESRESRSDALTGLLNRRAFEERLPVELARFSRSGRPLSLSLLDLDGFKGVNDRLGHPAGDEVALPPQPRTVSWLGGLEGERAERHRVDDAEGKPEQELLRLSRFSHDPAPEAGVVASA